MNKKKSGIALAVLGLTVGFAAVSTTLYINGTAVLKENPADFEEKVIFTAAAMEKNTDGAARSDDNKTITFTTADLDEIGDYDVLTYEITNNSTYNAKLHEIDCKYDDEHITVTHEKALEGVELARGASTENKLTVTMKKSFIGDTADETSRNVTITCTIDADALEASAN